MTSVGGKFLASVCCQSFLLHINHQNFLSSVEDRLGQLATVFGFTCSVKPLLQDHYHHV
jgi:hypothetical protein